MPMLPSSRFSRLRAVLLPLLLVALSAAIAQAQQTAVERGARYRSFATAAELAAHLRVDSAAGPLLSAHRGGPAEGFPENALETFERTLGLAPALIECDVRRSKDGVLVLMHDGNLARTTTGTGDVGDRTLAELRRLRLRDPGGDVTPCRIPTLAEALTWAEGRAVLTLDIKRRVEPQDVVAAVRAAGAENRAVVIVYTVEDYARYLALAPELVYSVSIRDRASLDAHLAAGLRADRAIAFVGVGRFDAGLLPALTERGIRAILGTFGELDERGAADPSTYLGLVDAGIGVLATDEPAAAAAALTSRSGAEETAGRGR